ncbi:MAG: molybdenum cofactor guanylyltransferase [Nitrospirae bacterium]|nr:molybdenum cofactor guanylyltransferase [Nitrospirota bacterium]
MDAIILAGGENRRFQSHKALVEIRGRKLIEKTSELLLRHFGAVHINTNTPELFFYLGLPLIGDIFKQRSPMTGIYSSLVSTGASELFFAACDMPFIEGDVIELIKGQFCGQDAVLAADKGVPQPLLGIYSRRLIPELERRLNQNRKAMWDLLPDIAVDLVPERAMSAVDPEGRSFMNFNTVEEYRDLIIPV